MTLTNKIRHKSIEKCKKQCCYMSSINVGISHDDYLVITKLFYIKILMYSCSESCNHSLDFFVFHYMIYTSLLDIEYLSSKWKYSLSCSVTCGLCRTTGGISLDYIYLTILWILIRTVCKLARK